MKQNEPTMIAGALASATGKIEYGFTNDYMFRAILQQNKKVLKALIGALLHLKPENILSVEITNPIELGKKIDAKEFILDIKISLNNRSTINLEMQVRNQYNWEEISLSYLCRSFDQLNSGDEYKKALPAIHIGFLDFTPFPKVPEFYATYKLLNVKNHHLYSSKFSLGVVDLTKIDLATEEDRKWQIDHWARLFKAKTWEDLKMIAKENEAMQEASETLYNMHCEQTIRDMARAREDQLRWENGMKRHIADLEADIEKLSSDNEDLSSELAKKDAKIAELERLLNNR
ncbi:MAG: Rpn family recombination-promoting nuclease/putative transposase [Lachnospiraceae bacterium]|nr:Rpn family recombination-promoting nuclease/putative transposase [Lachnospiraceae bacterium]